MTPTYEEVGNESHLTDTFDKKSSPIDESTSTKEPELKTQKYAPKLQHAWAESYEETSQNIELQKIVEIPTEASTFNERRGVSPAEETSGACGYGTGHIPAYPKTVEEDTTPETCTSDTEPKRVVTPNEMTEKTTETKDDHDTDESDWDDFEENVDQVEETSLKSRKWKTAYHITKVLFVVLLFICVLGSALLAKTTLIILVSNIAPPTNFTSTNNFSLKTINGVLKYSSSGRLKLR